MSALNGDLLGLVFLFIGHLGNLDLASSCYDSVLWGSEIPNNNLSIDTSTNNNVLFVRVELDASDFDWGFQNVIIVDDVRVTEVHNQHVSEATLARVFASLVKVGIFNQGNSDQVVFHRMELNATDSHSSGVILISGASFVHVLASSALCNGGLIFVSKHVEVVLENIDDFI
jgi:hypothetical protein